MLLSRKLFWIAAFSLPLAARAQSPGSVLTPSFDVASVRQNKTSGPQRSSVPLDAGNVYSTLDPGDTRTAAGGYFVAANQPLWRYIAFAYKLSGTQELALRFSMFEGLKSKAPSWVTGGLDTSADRFNIEARAPENTTIDEMRRMMQALLAERFQLVVHRESRDAPAFALVLVHPGATGPNLKPPLCGVIAHVSSSENPRSSFGGRAVPLSLLATSLPTMTGMATLSRPVVDRTGLTGLYDFTLQWNASTDPETGDNAAFFRSALKDQLGLELKPAHAPFEILVIDRVERPSQN
jgi:uncharacterized protein (TIGR03435 family)